MPFSEDEKSILLGKKRTRRTKNKRKRKTMRQILDHAFRRSLSLAYSVSLGTDDQRNQKHIDVAEWLTTFSPEYDIQIAYKPIITSNPNIIERNKKKIKWYKKKNMVWLSSQEPGSTGDNLVARLPTDVVRISSSYL
jgi:hypothetical protein